MLNVLIVDDSAIVCSMMKSVMSGDQRFKVCATAENGLAAINANKEFSPDLIIMDYKMPVMDGIEASKKILEETEPTIVIFTTEEKSLIENECMKIGIQCVEQKPDLAKMTIKQLEDFCSKLFFITKSHQEKKARSTHPKIPFKTEPAPAVKTIQTEKYELLLIGASTGGPAAIKRILSDLPNDFPLPIVITQHIDEHFDGQLTNWLSGSTGFPVSLAKDGITCQPGHVYIAPSDRHLCIKRNPIEQKYIILLNDDPPVHFLRPSVDKMFESVTTDFASRIIAIILTGMGRDGAEGIKRIYNSGGFTIAESEKTSIVFGMPKAAIDLKGITKICDLEKIAPLVSNLVYSEAERTNTVKVNSSTDTVDDEILSIIKKHSGLILNEAHKKYISLYIKTRVSELKISIEDYTALLKKSDFELTKLINAATINETYFYREQIQFEFLDTQYLPELKQKGITELNIWSGACSSGEEAISIYSLCIKHGITPVIYATDIDTEILYKFKALEYSDKSFRHDGEYFHHNLKHYELVKKQDDIYKANKDLLDYINICQYNLCSETQPPFSKKMDVVFLRNVFIYFEPEMQKKILLNASKIMKKDGILFVSVNEIGQLSLIPDLPFSLEKSGQVYYLKY